MTLMFEGCSSLDGLDLSTFDLSVCEQMGSAFADCSSLRWVDPSCFSAPSCRNMESMFADCSSLRGIDLLGVDVPLCKDMGRMFAGCPCVLIDGIHLKRGRGGPCENAGIPAPVGASGDGRREIIGRAEGLAEPKGSRRELLPWLKGRGLSGVRMVAGDKRQGTVGALEEVFPRAGYQRRAVHLCRNLFSKAPERKRAPAARMLRTIHARESGEAATAEADEAAAGPEGMRPGAAAGVVRGGCPEAPACAGSPMRHWAGIRADNAIGRPNREIRRRTGVVGTFPDGRSALMPVTAGLKCIAECERGERRYLDASLLHDEWVEA